MKAEEIAYGLKKWRRLNDHSFVACCPAHNDNSPSLAITDKGDRTLVYCRSGCTQRQVIAALEAEGLWLTSNSTQRPAINPCSLSEDELLTYWLISVCEPKRPREIPFSESEIEEYCKAVEIVKKHKFYLERAAKAWGKLPIGLPQHRTAAKKTVLPHIRKDRDNG